MPPPSPLPTSFFCGTGNVGVGLALALAARGWPVLGAWNRSPARAAVWQKRLAAPVHVGTTLPPVQADLIWVTVSDDAVPAVGRQLALQALPPTSIAVHTSGCLSAAALGPQPIPVASLHPLLACPSPEHARDGLPGAFFALEGDPAALPRLEQVVQSLGGQSERLAAAGKARYHAAAAMAANLAVALIDLAAQEAADAGLSNSTSLVRFAHGAVQHALSLGTLQALTGPALRGDLTTLRAHLEGLSPQARAVYRALSQHALQMAQQRGLPAPTAQAALRLLEQPWGDTAP